MLVTALRSTPLFICFPFVFWSHIHPHHCTPPPTSLHFLSTFVFPDLIAPSFSLHLIFLSSSHLFPSSWLPSVFTTGICTKMHLDDPQSCHRTSEKDSGIELLTTSVDLNPSSERFIPFRPYLLGKWVPNAHYKMAPLVSAKSVTEEGCGQLKSNSTLCWAVVRVVAMQWAVTRRPGVARVYSFKCCKTETDGLKCLGFHKSSNNNAWVLSVSHYIIIYCWKVLSR